MNLRHFLKAAFALSLSVCVTSASAAPEPKLILAPSKENPRNSEGDFIKLNDGRILFIYTHFLEGAQDNSPAYLAARVSRDAGETWSADDELVVGNEARENVMSVSLLRLMDGRIALLYLRKNSWDDCRPWIRFSDDEARTWSEAAPVISEPDMGYYVVNNDRMIQLKSGRLVVPAAQHKDPSQERFDPHARIVCYLSDDGGRSWRRGKGEQDGRSADGPRVMLQEPGVVELKDGRILLFCRTASGAQFVSWSSDGCETFPPFVASHLKSPLSPASIERIPSTGDLLVVWNDHEDVQHGNRTPLTLAISSDDGETWTHRSNLHDNPHGWYCYTAIEFVGDSMLLGYCAGDRRENNGLALTQIMKLPVRWINR